MGKNKNKATFWDVNKVFKEVYKTNKPPIYKQIKSYAIVNRISNSILSYFHTEEAANFALNTFNLPGLIVVELTGSYQVETAGPFQIETIH